MKLGLTCEAGPGRLQAAHGKEPIVCELLMPATTDSLVALARALRFASAEAVMAQRIAHQRGLND